MSIVLWIVARLIGLRGFIVRQFRWLFAKDTRVIITGLMLLCIVSLLMGLHLLGQRDHARAAFAAERAAHEATKDAVVKAAEEADRRNEWRLRAVTREQAAITERTVHDYETRLADARARAHSAAERLRIALSTAAQRRPEGPAMPAASGAAARVDEAASDTGLPAACDLTLDERLIATEQAVQLDTLIDWVEQQSRVEVNP